jgi:hypothetical protein
VVLLDLPIAFLILGVIRMAKLAADWHRTPDEHG